MKLPDLFVNAITTFDGKALAKGQKQIGGFEKSVKNLGKAFGITFGAAAIAQFGKASVKAFAEDQAAAVRLTKAVNNLGLGFEDTRISRFISDLESSAHVADDILRPAFQSLISTTGSVTRSQELLTLALDISAGTGVDAAEVASDLGRAYLGQTKGLAKYNTGLSKAELSAMSFTQIQAKLLAQYSGQNAARVDTYAGKVEAVNIAYGNLQETVGGALIDAFMKLAGDTTVDDLTDSVDNLAESLAAVVELTAAVATPFVNLAKFFNNASDAYVKLLYKVTGSAYMGKKSDRQYGGAYADKYKSIEEKANAKARAKAEAEAAKREKERLALLKKGELAKKNEISLSKASAEFDTNRISIAAALKATYDKDTRLRLEALMAIEDENGALALEKIRQLGLLQEATDAQKLAGIKTISDATLSALNAQLLKELEVIEKSKMSEADKDAAREEAFKKYNAALTAAGVLAAEEAYSEKTRIELLKIAKIAAITDTKNAQLVAQKLLESEELNAINRVQTAQATADAARLAALNEYIAALKSLGTVTGGVSNGSILGGTKAPDPEVAAAIKSAEDAAAKGSAEAKDALAELTDATKAETDATESLAKNSDTVEALKELGDALAAETDALTDTTDTTAITDAINAAEEILKSVNEMPGTLASFKQGEIDTLLPTITGSVGGGGGAFDRNYYVTINAGAIASQDEFTVLLQDTIQKINRNGDPLTTAGIA